MFAELPVICFDINYNRSTTQQKALYFSDANDLIKILNDITNRQLKPIAEDMKKMANLNYTWGKITEHMPNYWNILKHLFIHQLFKLTIWALPLLYYIFLYQKFFILLQCIY